MSIWLTIANFIKKPGYNAYNEDLAEQHNVLLIDYNEDLHYKQTELHYKKLHHHKFITVSVTNLYSLQESNEKVFLVLRSLKKFKYNLKHNALTGEQKKNLCLKK